MNKTTLHAVMLRHPDGRYLHKTGARSWRESPWSREVNPDALFRNTSGVRSSLGQRFALDTPTLNEVCGFDVNMKRDYMSGPYSGMIREAMKRMSELSTPALFELLKKDGFTLVEVKLELS